MPVLASKKRVTLMLPPDLLETMRNTGVALAGPPERLNLAKLAERALRAEIARLEKQPHRGKPFPPDTEPLSGGRPVGSG